MYSPASWTCVMVQNTVQNPQGFILLQNLRPSNITIPLTKPGFKPHHLISREFSKVMLKVRRWTKNSWPPCSANVNSQGAVKLLPLSKDGPNGFIVTVTHLLAHLQQIHSWILSNRSMHAARWPVRPDWCDIASQMSPTQNAQINFGTNTPPLKSPTTTTRHQN